MEGDHFASQEATSGSAAANPAGARSAAAGSAAIDPSQGGPEAVRLAAGGSAAGSGVAGSTEDASLPAAASVSASALLPRKRHATDSEGMTEAVQDDVDTILGLCGVAKEMPESIEHKGKR